jgi:hypothetical protein
VLLALSSNKALNAFINSEIDASEFPLLGITPYISVAHGFHFVSVAAPGSIWRMRSKDSLSRWSGNGAEILRVEDFCSLTPPPPDPATHPLGCSCPATARLQPGSRTLPVLFSDTLSRTQWNLLPEHYPRSTQLKIVRVRVRVTLRLAVNRLIIRLRAKPQRKYWSWVSFSFFNWTLAVIVLM